MNYLGQHFLKNQSVLENIVNSLDLKTGETVLEIGPGKGALTQQLIKHPVGVIAVEKDKQLIQILESRIKNQESGSLKIIEGDILKLLPELTSKLGPRSWKLVGNIPYYITGYLLRTIGGLENKPALVVLTIQKEVAERLIAQPPRMNLLATSVQIWAEPEIIQLVPPTDFEPAPKVWSAVVKLRIRNYESGITGNYYKLIKIIFKQPRKTILNNLADSLNLDKEIIKQKLGELNLTGKERPQNLSIQNLLQLTAKFIS